MNERKKERKKEKREGNTIIIILYKYTIDYKTNLITK